MTRPVAGVVARVVNRVVARVMVTWVVARRLVASRVTGLVAGRARVRRT